MAPTAITREQLLSSVSDAAQICQFAHTDGLHTILILVTDASNEQPEITAFVNGVMQDTEGAVGRATAIAYRKAMAAVVS